MVAVVVSMVLDDKDMADFVNPADEVADIIKEAVAVALNKRWSRRDANAKSRPSPEPTKASTASAQEGQEDDYEGMVEFSDKQFERFIEDVSPEYEAGVRVIAEKGKATEADLATINIHNTTHFQSRLTRRVRTVMNRPRDYFVWWRQSAKDKDGNVRRPGYFYVTPTTLRAMRRYYGMEEVS